MNFSDLVDTPGAVSVGEKECHLKKCESWSWFFLNLLSCWKLPLLTNWSFTRSQLFAEIARRCNFTFVPHSSLQSTLLSRATSFLSRDNWEHICLLLKKIAQKLKNLTMSGWSGDRFCQVSGPKWSALRNTPYPSPGWRTSKQDSNEATRHNEHRLFTVPYFSVRS